MTNPKISVILPAYKSKDLISSFFLKSFFSHTSQPCELLIYDNGPKEENLKSAIGDAFTNVFVLGEGENIGLHAAYNECIKVARGDWVYLPHTDMYLLPQWDISLINAAKFQPLDKILLCSRSIEPFQGHTNHHKIVNFGESLDDFREERLLAYFIEDYLKSSDMHKIEVGARMPFFLHRRLLDKMQNFNQKNDVSDGPFDDHYFSYCQDDDIVQTAYHLGVRRFWMSWGSVVYHLQGQSNKKQSVDRDSQKPYEYFVEKWKRYYPQAHHPGMWHPKLIPFCMRVK